MITIRRKVDWGPIEIQEVRGGELHLLPVRTPGHDLSDLPADLRSEIEEHWTPERVAAWEARAAQEQALLEAEVGPTPAHVDHEMWRRIAALLGVRSHEAARDALALMETDARRALQPALDALRSRAAELGSLDPLPDDYADDKHWETPEEPPAR